MVHAWRMKLADYLASTGTRPYHLALAAGLPASSMHRILTGQRTPSFKAMQAISKATGGKVSKIEDFIMAKRTKASVNYTDKASMQNSRCDACRHFTKPRGCKLVEGDISPGGWCKLFER